ncbi:hypothetical protein JG687_00013195 [Phytophthora cactorum]|uniref:DDE-1 domain-containing protein n=1 Tax=Phytophthora cactorum TaxID=29920 RepID=A0A8T1U1W8_9STRA|nr:hypothetical protein JG687_00013195 [Phytophthora cactorum]
MKEQKISKVFNADQTGVNYNYVSTQTIAARGTKTVWGRCAGKSKERVTTMLLGDSDGNKLDPFLDFKTKPRSLLQQGRTLQRAEDLADSCGPILSRSSRVRISTVTLPLGGTVSSLLHFQATIFLRELTCMGLSCYCGTIFQAIGVRTY